MTCSRKLYKTKKFAKLARDLRITDAALCDMVKETAKIDPVGKNIYKLRVSVNNSGKSDGARTILTAQRDKDLFLIYCYPKSAVKAGAPKELSDDDIEALELDARKWLGLNPAQIAVAVKAALLMEVPCDGLCDI